ncbi:MAG: hypothetical protein QOC66_706 [Pseudonocardiales bacterium]|jgi:hypothetical protein|nr:hypothetical protein [Pseudonocardiales bacterium]
MTELLERGAEITKLARLLGVERKELDHLDQIPASALRAFREQATDRLFAGDAGRLRRVAAASKLVPVPLTVKVAQAAFGPLLCAATAGLLEPSHAVKVAAKCPTAFLADIAITLDPRRAADVIAAVPTPLVVAVAKELIARREHVTIGRFVSFLRPETLRAAVPEIPDDADLLKVAFVMEGKDRLDDLVDLARDRLPGLIRTAFERDLWAEALDLIGHLSVENVAELADLAAAQSDEVLTSLVRAAQDLPAWDALLPITAAMSGESLRRFAAIPAIQEPEVLAAIVLAASRADLWDAVLPLAELVLPKSEADLQRVLDLIAAVDRTDEIAALVAAPTPEPKRGRPRGRSKT